jgi:hypothetical protein
VQNFEHGELMVSVLREPGAFLLGWAKQAIPNLYKIEQTLIPRLTQY